MGQVEGKVAFITGAARGQGRADAVRLAEEGADIVAVDLLSDIEGVNYPLARESDMEETADLVQSLGRRIIVEQADVRDLPRLEKAARRAVSELGHIDIVIANAGICTVSKSWEMSEETWQTLIDINLTGVWKTIRATAPVMIEAGRGGSIMLISSIAGLAAFPNMVHYNAAKHGVIGIMRAYAIELGQFNIRVNSVHPTNVSTDMLLRNPPIQELMTGNPHAGRDDLAPALTGMHAFNIPWIKVSNLVVWLGSDKSRYVTGTAQVLDAGALAPFKIPH